MMEQELQNHIDVQQPQDPWLDGALSAAELAQCNAIIEQHEMEAKEEEEAEEARKQRNREERGKQPRTYTQIFIIARGYY